MSDILTDGLAALDRQLGIEPGTDEAAADTTTEATEVVTPALEETTETTETIPVSQPEPTEDEVKFASYLNRFGVEDPAALAELKPEVQKALRAGFEADSMVGRRSQELGEVKKELEQIREQTAPQEPAAAQYDPDSVQDHFAEHPTSILPTIQQAYQTGDMNLVYLGIHALSDVDPVLAEGLRVEIAKRGAVAEMSPHIARNERADFNTTFATAWNQVKADHPDIDQFADQILQTAQDDPEALMGLSEGTPEGARRVLTNLYKIAAFDASKQDGSTLATAAATAAAEQAAEADAAKREGFVATGTQRVESEQVSEGEKWLQTFFDPGAKRYMPDE